MQNIYYIIKAINFKISIFLSLKKKDSEKDKYLNIK